MANIQLVEPCMANSHHLVEPCMANIQLVEPCMANIQLVEPCMANSHHLVEPCMANSQLVEHCMDSRRWRSTPKRCRRTAATAPRTPSRSLLRCHLRLHCPTTSSDDGGRNAFVPHRVHNTLGKG
jgi:hypothetical protein